MKIFVISLPDATDRRSSARTQLGEAGLEFRFLDGLNGAAAWRGFTGYDSKEYRIRTGRPAAPGEVGCFASHASLWRRCVDMNEPIVVMEDDFYAHSNFAAAVVELEGYIHDFGFVRLEETNSANTIPVINCGEFSLEYCRKYPHNTTCYAISPRVATEFLAQSNVLRAPVDKFIKNFWEHGQPLYSLQPAPVMRELAFDSAIGIRDVVQQSLGLRLRRMVRKALWAVGRARFNARMMKQSKPEAEPEMNTNGSASIPM